MASSPDQRNVSEDFDRPPDSSGDEEDSGSDSVLRKKQSTSSTVGVEARAPSPPQSTKPMRNFRTSRARPGRLQDQPDIAQVTIAPTSQTEDGERDGMVFSGSKRRCTDYSQRRKASGNVLVPDLPSQPQFLSAEADFHVPGMIEDQLKQDPPSRTHDALCMPEPLPGVATVHDKETRLKVPAAMAPGPASSSTSAADSFLALEMPGSPMDRRPKRSRSSSLSSIDSLASLQLDRGAKDAMLQRDDDNAYSDKWSARCPLCNGKVDQVHLETFNFGRRMNVRAQQRFCHEHREKDAERLREKNEYPTPEWPDVLGRRIRDHEADLTRILLRNKPSYYRAHLDDAIDRGKKSRKGVQKYLKEEVVDILKYGYYGPKGARLMGHAITERMSDILKETLSCDSVARSAGVGGYVNAVLVPELLVGLVMEDMHLDDAAQARNVLAESSDVGIMLNGDEEVVAQLEEEVEV